MAHDYWKFKLEGDGKRDHHDAIGDVDSQQNQWPRPYHRQVFRDGSALVWWMWKDGKVVGPSVSEPRVPRRREGIVAI